jgi:hypothetical protein
MRLGELNDGAAGEPGTAGRFGVLIEDDDGFAALGQIVRRG